MFAQGYVSYLLEVLKHNYRAINYTCHMAIQLQILLLLKKM